MTNSQAFESFSFNAAEAIRLRLALYGPEDAQALMRRCYGRSKANRINETTVWNCWEEQDDALNAALEGVTVADVQAKRERQREQWQVEYREKVAASHA